MFPCLERDTADFSECGRYRFRLTRRFKDGIGVVNFIMLNPSTATADIDDPTIRRCMAFARAWRASELVVTNIFALRATDPRELRRVADPVGPENDEWILGVAQAADRVICAWGNHGRLGGRGTSVAAMLRTAGVELHALRITKLGQPQHPLYLPAALRCTGWLEA